jgi:redox-sensitive bicupin YhaK (pirin superfamily)
MSIPHSDPASLSRSARTIEGLHNSNTLHWVGNAFQVTTCFPSTHLPAKRVSPFVHLDYAPPREFAALARGRRGGGWHPHKGVETVTMVWEGAVAHRDNAGHSGIIGAGDVQWTTAASGLLHEEYHAEEMTRRGGPMHMMQLWVNLPKKDKAAAPCYQSLAAATIPSVSSEGGARIRIIAGEYAGAEGPARTFTPVTLLDAQLNRGALLSVKLPARYNALALIAKGRVRAGAAAATGGQLVLFANDGTHIELASEADGTHVVVLAGEPIDEPIVQYGSFVMNTVEEVEQAVRDAQQGKFGPQQE